MRTHKSIIAFATVALFLMSFALAGTSGWTVISKTDVEKATKNVSNFYKEKSVFSVNVTHQTFIGHHSTAVHDESKGYLKRKGNLYHSFMLGIHSFQDDALGFVVDSVNRAIIISDKKNNEANKDIKLETMVTQENAIAFKKSEINGKQAYRVDYNKNHPLEATEMLLNSDHSIGEITMYFHDERPVSKEDNAPTAKGKAKIIYSGYNLTPVFKQDEFSHKKYFTIKDKKVVLTAAFAKYKIIDNRIYKGQKND